MEFIKSRGVVPERNVPFYVSWVRRYLQTEMPGVIVDLTDKLQFFCEQLDRQGGVQDWQMDQARRAVELYERVYRKEPLPNAAPERPLAEGETAGERMRDLIRLRHYSLRTEQTYLDWVRRSLAYTKANQLDWQSDGAIRSYLSLGEKKGGRQTAALRRLAGANETEKQCRAFEQKSRRSRRQARQRGRAGGGYVAPNPCCGVFAAALRVLCGFCADSSFWIQPCRAG
jgi:hypothetical protein